MEVRKVSGRKSGLQSHLPVGNGAIRKATYDFLLVCYYSHVSILQGFRYIITFAKT